MVFFHQNIGTAKPTERYDIPPYHVDSFPGFDAQRHKSSAAGRRSGGLPGYVTEMEDEHERPM